MNVVMRKVSNMCPTEIPPPEKPPVEENSVPVKDKE